jgi:hypothetical protein
MEVYIFLSYSSLVATFTHFKCVEVEGIFKVQICVVTVASRIYVFYHHMIVGYNFVQVWKKTEPS